MAAAFDTLAYARRLREAGVPEAQAEVQAEALNEFLGGGVATKADIEQVRADLRQTRTDLDVRITQTRIELEARITQTRTDLQAQINLVHWMLGFELALTVAILAKLLIGH